MAINPCSSSDKHVSMLLDKALFKKTLEVVGVRVEAKKIGRVVRSCTATC